METKFIKWLDSVKDPADNDSELARKLKVSRNQVWIWRKGVMPRLGTFKNVYFRLGLPNDKESFWKAHNYAFDDIIFEQENALPYDHICNEMTRLIDNLQLETPLEEILGRCGVSEAEWNIWQHSPDMDVGHKRTITIIRTILSFKKDISKDAQDDLR